MPSPTYSALGERLYQLLCTEIKSPPWSHFNSERLRIGQMTITVTPSGTMGVVLQDQSNSEDAMMTRQLTPDDTARLVPMVRAAIKKLSEFDIVQRVNGALVGVPLGPSRDPARAKLTESAVTMARLILKAAESDSVDRSELMQMCDKVREDLES